MFGTFGMFAALILVLSVAAPTWAVELPAPRTEGGMGLFEALKNRASAPGGDFPTGRLEAEELSSVLWAATGLNRGDKGWTVPMAMGLPPYCKVYVAKEDGVFLYDWSSNSLAEISGEDIRALVGAQNFVRTASCILIFVSDGKGLSEFQEPERTVFAYVAAGAMTQDVYLAAAALGLGARYIHSINVDAIQSALRLEPGNNPLCLMLLGK